MSTDERMRIACRNMARFRWEPHYVFWRNVYLHLRDELEEKKAGKSAATDNPASDNHDGKPAA